MTGAKKQLIAASVLFAAGIAAGSLAAVRTLPETLYGYFRNLAESGATSQTAAAVCDALVLWAVLFFSAFFRFGGITVAAAIGIKGFTDGYAVASIFRILGAKGLGLCFFDILGAPLALFTAAFALRRLAENRPHGSRYITGGGILLLLMCLTAALCARASAAISVSVLAAIEL